MSGRSSWCAVRTRQTQLSLKETKIHGLYFTHLSVGEGGTSGEMEQKSDLLCFISVAWSRGIVVMFGTRDVHHPAYAGWNGISFGKLVTGSSHFHPIRQLWDRRVLASRMECDSDIAGRSLTIHKAKGKTITSSYGSIVEVKWDGGNKWRSCSVQIMLSHMSRKRAMATLWLSELGEQRSKSEMRKLFRIG
jgi:hypothetical protein